MPESLKKLSFRLSELLHVADQIAQDIRDEVTRKREPLKGKFKKITDDSLSLIYKKVFKELPPEYLIRTVRNKCQELSIDNIKSIEKVLTSKRTRSQLSLAYKKATGWDIYDGLIFQISPLMAACGIRIATDAVAKLGKQEWEDADRIYRSEIKSELPATFEEFLDYIGPPLTKDDLCDSPERIYRLAEALDALKECSICGAPIVDEEMFSQNAQEHYEVEDETDQIESLVLSSGADVGEGSLCSYHAYHADDD